MAGIGYQTDKFKSGMFYKKLGLDVNYLKLEEVSMVKKIERRLHICSELRNIYW